MSTCAGGKSLRHKMDPSLTTWSDCRLELFVVALLLVALPMTVLATPVAGASDSPASIGTVSVSGSGTFVANDTQGIWQSSAVNVTVPIETRSENDSVVDLCVGLQHTNVTRVCESVRIENGQRVVQIELPAQRNVTTGRHRLVVTLNQTFDGQPVDNTSVPVTVLRRDGDVDQDRLRNIREYEAGLDMYDPDMDEDGLLDGDEVDRYGTDPTDADTDNDGLSDGTEVLAATDPTDPDSDGDMLRDGLERHLLLGADSAVETLLKLGGLLCIAVVAGGTLWRQQTGSASDDTPTVAASTDTAETAAPKPDPELLSADERIETLLENEGGRMRQTDIVEATDWSKAKVSRTLSEMEDDDVISRFRLGRENVVTLGDRPVEDDG